jgi:hypothetical protein
MNSLPHPTGSGPEASPRNLLHTALFGAALFLTPLLVGCLFVIVFTRFSSTRHTDRPDIAGVTNRLADASVTNVADLLSLYHEGRSGGFPTDEVNLRVWAAQATQPATLFHVNPPEAGKRWNWHLSQDGHYAIAVSIEFDTLQRHQVGLYDLIAEEWVWNNTLPWPDSHENPYVFNRHVILRYVKNAKCFALELNPEGHIISIDTLGRGVFALTHALPSSPAFPGTPVAVKSGIFFVTDNEHKALIGYAMERLPGLRYAGKGDDNTLFSGNGLLKFTITNGTVTVSDSLTQTSLQQISVWRPGTNVVVTGALTTHDGSGLNVFLKTDLGGLPPITRDWSVSLATYTGTVVPSFNADAQLAKPRRSVQREAVSRDGKWRLSVTEANDLVITKNPENREVARVALAPLLGLSKPVNNIVFLEKGRHVSLRQGDNYWLLDFKAACGYADLLSRLQAAVDAAAQTSQTSMTNAPAYPSDSDVFGDLYAADEWKPDAPSTSLLALRAEWFAAHQTWPYVSKLLSACAELAAADSRAPRVNPLLQARAEILSGQRQKARTTCRLALQELLSDPSSYNHMIRYHLQGLLFSQP